MNSTSLQPDAAPPLPGNVKLLGIVALLNDIAGEMIYPLLSVFFLTVLHGNRTLLGAVEGLAESLSSLLKLWSGGRSDQAGRRKGFIVLGYSLATLARPLLAVVGAPWQFGALRITDKLGKGVRTSPRDALIADSTDATNRGRSFGFHQAMDHLGAAIGPLFGAGLLYFWPDVLRPLFLLTIIPGVCVVGLLVFGLREPKATTPPKERFRLTLAPFDRNFVLFLAALFVFTLGNSSDVFLLDRAQELGLSKMDLLLLWSVFHVAKSTANIYLGRAVDHLGPRPFIFLGWLVYAGVYLAFGLATEAWHIWALFLAYAVFYGLTEPSEKTLVANLVGKERKGLAYGWYNFAIGLGALPASLLFGTIRDNFGAFAAFSSGAGLALAAAMLLSFVRQPNHPATDAT